MLGYEAPPALYLGQAVWLRRLQRCMLGHEKLALQGFGEDDIDVRNYDMVDDSRRGALAGDMFNLGSVAQVMASCIVFSRQFR